MASKVTSSGVDLVLLMVVVDFVERPVATRFLW